MNLAVLFHKKVELTVIRDDSPSLTITPTITGEDAVTVEVNGNEQGEEVFVNGVGTGITLSADKKAVITLDTSGEDGHKNFTITLNRSGSDYFSNSLFVSIFKDTTAPELVSGWPAANETIALTSTNNLELIYTFIDGNGLSSIKIFDRDGNDVSANATINGNSITLPLVPQEDTSYFYTIVAEDNIGNQKEVVVTFNVKHYAPVTTASLPGGFYSEPISIDLISSEESTIYYSTDGYPPIIGAANTQQGNSRISNIAISLTTNLQYFAVDAAGNKETTNSTVYRFGEIEDYDNNIIATYDESNQQVNLSWGNDSDVKEYRIYRVASKLDLEVLTNSKKQQYLAPDVYRLDVSTVDQFNDSRISNGATYYYAISKVNQNGIESVISEAVEVVVQPASLITGVDDAITRAKNWLYGMQNIDGSWGSKQRSKLLQTTSALDALQGFKHENQYITNKALAYVLGAYADNNDYLSRQIVTLANYELYTRDKVNRLLSQSWFNDYNLIGWGLLKRYRINALDTALASRAFKSSEIESERYINIEWMLRGSGLLLNDQGYWSLVERNDTSIYVSALVYAVIDVGPDTYAWITQAQNNDGSFGEGLLDTLSVMLNLRLSQEKRNQAAAYIISQQNITGDFNGDIYLTALALQALSQGVK